MRIGIVDLDTSHPAKWVPIERELGHEIVGVFDAGTVHLPGYAKQFAAEHNIPRVFASIDEMVGAVDCAIIHSCNWDTHVKTARPFIDAGKSVLIDKPLAGNVRDLRQLRDWAANGARITGGSSLRFCAETRQWLQTPVEQRGTPPFALCGCGVDEFNYGIHAYAMPAGILGLGAQSVRHLGPGPQRRVQITYADGRIGIVAVGESAAWLPFYATVVTEKSVAQYTADSNKLYRALLEATLPYLAGTTDSPPLTPDQWIEPELCAIAARVSWENRDREISICQLDKAAGYDGRAFAESYRRARYPAGS
jgi:hypothetical protein